MVLSAFSFSIMSVLVKFAGQRLPSQEIVAARAVLSLVLTWLMLRRAGVHPWGQQKGWLVTRGVFGFLGLSCVFYSLTHLPIAEATVIQYIHPVFTAVLAALFLGERAGPQLLVSMAICLAGVVLVARPGFGVELWSGLPGEALDPLAVVAGIGGAFFSACAYVVVRRLAPSENSLVIVLYFPLIALPASLPAVAPVAIWPEGWEWAALVGVGLATQAGQVALTKGLRFERAGRATSYSYLQIVFAALWGALIFGELPSASTLAGSGLILVGALLSMRGGAAERASG
ncbi:MAG: DMT family transporter [Deltaproteobacteria bacterium]|nr:DMT family transporter [Deltaproteobacteria bacterium]